MSTNLDLVLKTHEIDFVPVVLKLKPQHNIFCAATSLIQIKYSYEWPGKCSHFLFYG